MKNAVNILQKSIKDTRVAIVGGRILMDPDTVGILRFSDPNGSLAFFINLVRTF